MITMYFLLVSAFLLLASTATARDPQSKCDQSITTASGTTVHKDTFCRGELIFEDNFDFFDFKKWQHENTLAGGGNWEFQWYTNNRSNSFTNGGHLHIRPTLTSDAYDEGFLSHGVANVHGGAPADECTNPQWWGCERSANPDQILNPVRSARVRTVNSFSFKYGRLEIMAKLPAGDWLWPALWLLPRDNAYGSWPASGEIDLVESRGNRDYWQRGTHIGNQQMSSTLHFGPAWNLNGYETAHFERFSNPAWSNGFHRYQMEWTPDRITFSVDDIESGTIHAGSGFWDRGGFESYAPGMESPWRYATRMAPFDQEFYILINNAVGGTAFFPDDGVNSPAPKPWHNGSPTAARDFWNGRHNWLPTWGPDASLMIDWVRIWAL